MRLSTLILTAGLLTGLATPAARAQTFTDPGSYNNFIVNEQRTMLRKNLRYISKAAHSDNEKKVEARRLDVVKQNEVSLKALAKLPAFEGDKDFKENATEAFYQMLKVYSVDYKQIDMLAATRTATVENMERYFQLQEVADAKLKMVNDSVNAAQNRFARRHGMTLSKSAEDDKLEQYLVQVNEVNAYQHQVFLAQFRIEKPSARLTDAISAQDAAAFEAARAALQTDARTALAALATIPAFRSKDGQYRDAARNLVKFYDGMCADQFVKMTDLLTRKDKLTAADVKLFNGLINQYNTQNQKLVAAYNQAGNNFQAAYVPVFND
ncbi:LIC11966 family surface protein [Hymenobacter rubripertinctus]|uniref:DUF3829 domain-containing protein n=1 Tax=Hymenobacter rubripertinctus TaxID=2029981 RepID=A0A418QLS6_9BACT|nr:hypothetical protein [Hymenobacter rubripertinctus]RIY06039.1 hypothetical protein D0T11_19555 [Hymenobacter rubripertinctus]